MNLDVENSRRSKYLIMYPLSPLPFTPRFAAGESENARHLHSPQRLVKPPRAKRHHRYFETPDHARCLNV